MGCHSLRIEVAVAVMLEEEVIASLEREKHVEGQDDGEEVSGREGVRTYSDASQQKEQTGVYTLVMVEKGELLEREQKWNVS